MLAHGGAAGGDLVLGGGEIVAQAERFVVGGAQAAQGEVHGGERGGAGDEGEALADHQFGGEAQEGVEHAGGGLAGVVLDRDDRGVGRGVGAGGGEFDDVLAEADAAGGEDVAGVAVGEADGDVGGVVEAGEEGQQGGGGPLGGVRHREHFGLVGDQGGDELLERGVEQAGVGGGAGGAVPAGGAEA